MNFYSYRSIITYLLIDRHLFELTYLLEVIHIRQYTYYKVLVLDNCFITLNYVSLLIFFFIQIHSF